MSTDGHLLRNADGRRFRNADGRRLRVPNGGGPADCLCCGAACPCPGLAWPVCPSCTPGKMTVVLPQL
ncbi:MAG: hypothetical protein JWO31_792, partial [Phycisphaerales bacterium]|nr:hypothetical protein [Phycisphaerales bacterium]